MKTRLSFVSNSSSSSFILTGYEIDLKDVVKELDKNTVLAISSEEYGEGRDKVLLFKGDKEKFQENLHLFEEWKFYIQYNLIDTDYGNDENFDFTLNDVDKSLLFLEIDNHCSETLTEFIKYRGSFY